MKRVCKQCGKEFELSDSEIRFYQNKGLELPKRCQDCRNQNKMHGSSTERKVTGQESARMNNSVRRPAQSGGNHTGAVVSAAAVLLFLFIFAVKYFLPFPLGDITPTADSVSAELPQQEERVNNSETLPVENGDAAGQQQIEDGSRQQRSEEETSQLSREPEEQSALAEVQTNVEPVSEISQETAVVTYNFRKAQYLTEHFEKHGAEFPYATEKEYLAGANDVIRNPEALHKLEAEDGDDVYYVESTNEFVVVSTDGFIRTYFKADLDYYNRQ